MSNSGGSKSLSVTTTTGTVNWSVTISYEDGYGWINLLNTYGTGNGVVQFSVDPGFIGVGPTYSRTAYVTVTNNATPSNTYYCTVTQLYKVDEGGGGGGGGGGFPSQL